MVELDSVSTPPALLTPPPLAALLAVIVKPLRETVPLLLQIAPPPFAENPPWSVRPLIVTVLDAVTSKIRERPPALMVSWLAARADDGQIIADRQFAQRGGEVDGLPIKAGAEDDDVGRGGASGVRIANRRVAVGRQNRFARVT